MSQRLTLDFVVQQVRYILQDSGADRYDNARVLDALNMSLVDLQRMRPDIQSLTVLPNEFPYKPASLGKGTLVPLDTQYVAPFARLCAAAVELADDEFAVSGRVAALKQLTATQLTTGG